MCVCVFQALLCVDKVVSQKCADQLLLAALEFLSSLGKIFFPPDSQVIRPDYSMSISPVSSCIVFGFSFLFHTIYFVPQNPILPKLSSLFAVLLADGVWLLQQHALEAFSQFAEVGQDLDRCDVMYALGLITSTCPFCNSR